MNNYKTNELKISENAYTIMIKTKNNNNSNKGTSEYIRELI